MTEETLERCIDRASVGLPLYDPDARALVKAILAVLPILRGYACGNLSSQKEREFFEQFPWIKEKG